MKIISGKNKGVSLVGINIPNTRPTMDRVKESLFAMIQDYVKDSVVLDLYAGTGNLALEAISNGAKKAYLVDNSHLAVEAINQNIKKINADNAIVIKGKASETIKKLYNDGISFNIIFLDPPYDSNEISNTLKFINDNYNMLLENGIVVCETELRIDYSNYDKLLSIKERKYGNKIVNILKKK